jgi:signal transduction histidine kinase
MKKSGETYPVEVKAKIIYRDGKKYALCILSDISNRKKIEEEMVGAYEDLKELDRLKSNFVAIVSHELRTPVTVIKGFSSFMLKGVAGPLAPKQKEFVETISSNSTRLEMIINDLIDVSKIEAGIMSITKKTCDISKTTASAVSDMRIIAARKNITLDPEIEDSVTLNADAARIQQVVINLVNNAIKFSDAGSEITVGLIPVFKGTVPPEAGRLKSSPEKYACLSVRDRGIGIEKAQMKKVFDRFYQIESADVRKHQGAGLGLSIAKSIIDMHEGHIWCESEGAGKGTVFYAIIPNE